MLTKSSKRHRRRVQWERVVKGVIEKKRKLAVKGHLHGDGRLPAISYCASGSIDLCINCSLAAGTGGRPG
jgi:hypothetical protein